jgi:hypothetical protein
MRAQRGPLTAWPFGFHRLPLRQSHISKRRKGISRGSCSGSGSGSFHSHVRGRAYEELAPELELVDGHRFVVASSAPHPTPCACSGGRTSPLAMQRPPSFAKSASTASCEAASTAASLATAPQRPLPQLPRPLALPPLLPLPPLREEASDVVLDEPPGSSVLVGKGRSQRHRPRH